MALTLFNSRATGIFDLVDVYYLATFLRAHQYDTSAYRAAWCDILGFAGNDRKTYTDNYPPPFTVVRHADGTLVCFDGVQNIDQLIGFLLNNTLCNLVGVTGKVLGILRHMWLQMREDVFTRIAAAPNNSKIVVTGYSAGGALAAIATQAIKNRFPSSSIQWACSFGAPKSGDTAFCDAVTAPFLCLENEGDDLVHFPWATTRRSAIPPFGYMVALPDHPGGVLTLESSGRYAFGRNGVLTRNRLDEVVRVFCTNAAGGTPLPHALAEYVRRLGVVTYLNSKMGEFARMWALNRAMDNNVDPTDYTTPETPPPTVALAVPPAPAIADIQKIPSGDGDPLGPPVTYDTTLVGNTIAARTVAIVSHGKNKKGDKGAFHGHDKRLIHNTWRSLDQLNKRDALLLSGKRSLKLRTTLAKKLLTNAKIHMRRVDQRDLFATDHEGPTRDISTRKLIIDPYDNELYAAWNAVKAAIDASSLVLTNHTPLIDRSAGSAIDDQLHMVIENLRWLEYFASDVV